MGIQIWSSFGGGAFHCCFVVLLLRRQRWIAPNEFKSCRPLMESLHKASRRRKSNEIPCEPLPEMQLPEGHHLLITTEKKIYSRRQTITKVEFCSPIGGIVAAKEAGDGTGLLAVADSHIVVVCKTGASRKKYKLKAEDGRACLIAFANSCKDIIFSTSMQTSLRRYSIAQDRLLEFSCTHPSPPTALAVSPDSNYVVSASLSPPIVYLQDLRTPDSKIQIKPHASLSHVTLATFHPERDEIFLLGYADGTISVHTASRIVLMRSIGSDGNIGHLKRSHRTTNARLRKYERKLHLKQNSSSGTAVSGEKAVGILAAAFIGGYKLRVVSVASDGKCRVVDFEHGTSILRTWHVHGPCTSLATYSPKSNCTLMSSSVENFTTSQMPETVPSSYIIAVGRADGCLLLYDALGLLRDHVLVGHGQERIIDLAWIPDEVIGSVEILSPEPKRQSGVADVEWTFKDSLVDSMNPTKSQSAAQENYSPRHRLLDSLRSNRVRPSFIGPPRPESQPADSKKSEFKSSKNNAMTSIGVSNTTKDDQVEKDGTGYPTYEQQRATKCAISTDGLDIQLQGTEIGSHEYSNVLIHELATNQSTKHPLHLLQPSNLTPVRPCRASNSMPGEWVESSSSAGSPFTNGLNSALSESLMSPKPWLTQLNSQGVAESKVSCGRDTQRYLSRRSSSLTTTVKGSQRPTISVRKGSSPANKRQSEVKLSPARREHQERGGNREYNGSTSRPRGPQTLRRTQHHEQLHIPSRKKHGTGCTSGTQDENTSVPPAPPSSPILLTKPLHNSSKSDSSCGCDCDCSDVIREEMTLLRAEIAALRKGIWAFGSRIELTALGSRSGSPDDATQGWFTPVGR